MEQPKVSGQHHQTIKNTADKMESRFLVRPQVTRLCITMLVISVGSVATWMLVNDLRALLDVGTAIDRLFWTLCSIVITSFSVLVAVYNLVLGIVCTILRKMLVDHNMTCIIMNKHTLLIAFMASCFTLAGIQAFLAEIRSGYLDVLQRKDEATTIKLNMLLYILERAHILLLGLGAAFSAILVYKSLICILNYKMYTAHFAKRIDENKKSFEIIKLFNSTLGKRIHCYKEDAGRLVDSINIQTESIITNGQGHPRMSQAEPPIINDTAIRSTPPSPLISGTTTILSTFSTNSPCVGLDSLNAFYGEEQTRSIFEAMKPHRSDLITVEEFEMFFTSTFAEMNKLGEGLLENDSVINKLEMVIMVMSYVTAVIVFFSCIGKAESVWRIGVLVGSAMLAMGYVLAPIMLEVVNSLIFILMIRPFDVGDIIFFNDLTLKVVDIGITSTTFIHDSLHYHVSNQTLKNASIHNLRLSDSRDVVIPVTVPSVAFHARRHDFVQRLLEITEAAPTIYYQPCTIEHIQILGNGRLGLDLRVCFKVNSQEIETLQTNRDLFVLDLATVINDLELC